MMNLKLKEKIFQQLFYDNPDNKIDRIEKSVKKGPISQYFKRSGIVKRNIEKYKKFENQIYGITNPKTEIFYSDHHLSHCHIYILYLTL